MNNKSNRTRFQMLQRDPNQRSTIEDILDHPYIEDPSLSRPASPNHVEMPSRAYPNRTSAFDSSSGCRHQTVTTHGTSSRPYECPSIHPGYHSEMDIQDGLKKDLRGDGSYLYLSPRILIP